MNFVFEIDEFCIGSESGATPGSRTPEKKPQTTPLRLKSHVERRGSLNALMMTSSGAGCDL